MSVIIGSARVDERGKYSGGARGDQTGGEVSTQAFYVHSKGWYVLRPKKNGNKVGERMSAACNNNHIGYSQSDRYSLSQYGIDTNVNCNTDCSALVRQCIKEALGKDVGDFSTANEVSVLEASGLFEPRKRYTIGMVLKKGDVLVTCTKGHTVIVIDDGTKKSGGNPYSEPTALIKRGSKGDGAKWVQWELNQSGANLAVDGIIGDKSVAAIKDFQKKHNLEVDGIVGKNTRTMLKKVGSKD